MQATRILPDLQCSLLCEDVRQETSGNFIIVGIIGYVNVPQLPVTAFKLCVFNRWTAGIGQFNETVRMIAPDGTTVQRQSQVKFDVAGVYFMEVLVDDVMKLRFPIPVRVVSAPGQQQPATASGE